MAVRIIDFLLMGTARRRGIRAAHIVAGRARFESLRHSLGNADCGYRGLHPADHRRSGEAICVKTRQHLVCAFRGDGREQAAAGLRIGHDAAQPFRNLLGERYIVAEAG